LWLKYFSKVFSSFLLNMTTYGVIAFFQCIHCLDHHNDVELGFI
jgi:hypothetical protein